MSIIRTPTQEERKDFGNIGFKEVDAKKQFEEELGKKVQEAIKKKLPFAEKPCRDAFYDYYNEQARLSMRKHGYVESSEIKPINMDFNFYMDVKNFEVIEEGEISDQNLTKHNPGLDVKIAFKKYQFKGYKNTYMVMESQTDAILRARKVLKELEGTGSKK